MIRVVKLYGTTSSGGALTVTSTEIIRGHLEKVRWIDGDLADGVDATFSVDSADGVSPDETVLTLTDANADAVYYPRTPAHDNVGAAVTFDGTNEIYTRFVIDGQLKMVIASGGDTKSGGALVYVEV